MNAPFPFGFPFSTALYLVLYVGTLALHVVLMNYVIAGAASLAWSDVFRRDGESAPRGPLAAVLADWMPFALGGAITAGVAPLLFVQVLYRQQFYTANLLLFHRWMVILPGLMAGFYLLYLYKSEVIGRWPVGWRVAVGVLAFGCFAFVGYSWTENHLLSNRGEAAWTEFYGSGRLFYFDATLIPRLTVWFLGAFSTMLMIAAWQLRHFEGRAGNVDATFTTDELHRAAGRMGRLAAATLAGAVLGGLWYVASLPESTRGVLFGPLATPYLVVTVVGLVIQAVGWGRLIRSASFSTGGPPLITLGVVLAIVGTTVAREAIRLAEVDITTLYDDHAGSARVGGIWVFLFFLVLNMGVVAWCLRMLQRDLPRKT